MRKLALIVSALLLVALTYAQTTRTMKPVALGTEEEFRKENSTGVPCPSKTVGIALDTGRVIVCQAGVWSVYGVTAASNKSCAAPQLPGAPLRMATTGAGYHLINSCNSDNPLGISYLGGDADGVAHVDTDNDGTDEIYFTKHKTMAFPDPQTIYVQFHPQTEIVYLGGKDANDHIWGLEIDHDADGSGDTLQPRADEDGTAVELDLGTTTQPFASLTVANGVDFDANGTLDTNGSAAKYADNCGDASTAINSGAASTAISLLSAGGDTSGWTSAVTYTTAILGTDDNATFSWNIADALSHWDSQLQVQGQTILNTVFSDAPRTTVKAVELDAGTSYIRLNHSLSNMVFTIGGAMKMYLTTTGLDWNGDATVDTNGSGAKYADHAGDATTAASATSAGYADHSGDCTSAGSATTCGTCTSATSAGSCTTCTTATSATSAGSATTCGTCTSATSAGSATTCGTCTSATSATSATTATTAGALSHATSVDVTVDGTVRTKFYPTGIDFNGDGTPDTDGLQAISAESADGCALADSAGTALTATELAANPTDCGANTFATTIAANGNLTCAAVTGAGITDGTLLEADLSWDSTATRSSGQIIVVGADTTKFTTASVSTAACQMMICGMTSVAAGGTTSPIYTPLQGWINYTTATTEAYVAQPQSNVGLTFRHLACHVDIAPGAGSPTKSWIFVLRDDGASTALTCTISTAATTCVDDTNAPVVAAQSLVNFMVTSANSPATDHNWSCCVCANGP